MKILIVTSNYPRWQGDSTTPFVHNFAAELVKQGQQVRVLAPHFPGASLSEKIDGVEVKRFRYWYPLSGENVCYQGGALGNLKKNPLAKLKLPVLVLCEILSLLKEVVFWKPGLINSHWLIPQGFVAGIVASMTATRHVASVHGGDVFALDTKMMNRFKRFAIRSAEAVTVNSSVSEAKVREIAPKTETRLIRMPTGIVDHGPRKKSTIRELRKSLRQHEEEKLILFVGRLSEEKGIDDAIKALTELQNTFSVRLVIVGDGHDRAQFEQLAGSLGVLEIVNFEGWKDKEDVYDYFAAADVFVGPSKRGGDGWIEAQGLTFVEAMLNGCPVIGSDIGGIPDAVKEGKTGWLVKPGAPQALAEKIKFVLEHQELQGVISENARRMAIEQYLLPSAVGRFLSEISEYHGR